MIHLIKQAGVVRVGELCRELGISPATCRRDLEALESEGRIRRVYGGAVPVRLSAEEPLFDSKTVIAPREKRRIAEAAFRMIEEDDTIYLDGGSTVLELARLVSTRTDITVVTNSLRATIELSGKGPRVILVGGELRRRSQTIIGGLTRLLLQELRVDKAFMGTMGLSIEQGLTTSDPNEAFTKQCIMRQASRVILLMDSSKAGAITFAHSGSISDLDEIISDKKLPPAFARSLRKQKVKLTLV
jgi:DeoR/GlpR family transcriptional regulator of sugar metabolism